MRSEGGVGSAAVGAASEPGQRRGTVLNRMLNWRQQSVRTRRFLRILAALTLFALALRLLVCWQISAAEAVRDPWSGTDMATYRDLAAAILQGRFPDSYYYQPFYYAVFLPAVYAVFGVNPWGVMLVQSLLGAATVWLTGLLGARLFGRRAGLAAAVLLALARMHVFYTPFLLMTVLQSFWMILLPVAVLQAWAKRRWPWWLFTALVAAAAILTRGNVLLLLPGILVLLAWQLRRRPGRAVAAVLLVVLCIALVQLPFALRNARHHGRWTGPSSAQDAVLALGNTPEAPPGGLEYTATYRDWMELATRPPGERVPVSRQILHWFRRQPLAVLELKLRTFLLFWHRQEIPNNVALAQEGRHSAIVQAPFLIGFGVLGTLGVAGLLLHGRRRSAGRLFLVHAVLVYCLATVLFYMLARFRVPVLPLLCVFAGGTVATAGRFWRRYKAGSLDRGSLLKAVLAVCAAAFLVLTGFPFYQRFLEAAAVRRVRPGGVLVGNAARTLLYDHGSQLCGGWAYVPISTAPVLVRKRFVLPAPGAAATREVRFRIPIRAAADTRIEVEVVSPAGVSVRDSFSTAAARGLQWLVLPLPDLPAAAGVHEWKVRLQRRRGEAAFAVDRHRNYGRTAIRLPDSDTVVDVFEAAFELEWEQVTAAAAGSEVRP